MSKEDLEKSIQIILDSDYKEMENLRDTIADLAKQNRKLHNKIDKAITLIEKNISELRQLGEKEEEKDRWTALTIYAVKNSFFEVEEILKDSDVDEKTI